MEVHATIYHKVNVDPVDFINELLDAFLIERGNWIERDKDKFFLMRDLGHHAQPKRIKELTNKDIDYYKALQVVREFLMSEKNDSVEEK